MPHKFTYRISIAFLCYLISSCGSHSVKPWQKDKLAQPAMQFNAYPLESSFEEHFYFSKEGSSGGRSFSGGGCGCN